MSIQNDEHLRKVFLENKDKLFKDWPMNDENKHTIVDRRKKIKSDLRQIYKRYDGSHYIKLLDAIEDYIIKSH